MRDWVRTRLTVGVADQHGEFVHDLREVLRVAPGRNALPSAAIVESRTLQATPASGTRAGYDGAKRRRDSQVHLAVDTLGPLLALPVTAVNEQDRSHVHTLAEKVQAVTGGAVEFADVDQGDMGAQAAEAHHMQLAVVKLPEAKKGFVLLPKRWVVERRHAWAARFCRLARDDAQVAEPLAGLHFAAFAILMRKRVLALRVSSAYRPLGEEDHGGALAGPSRLP